MSRLGETHRAYNRLAHLLDEQIRQRSGSAQALKKFRETLDVAFYLLGWSQFEYLVRRQVEELIEEKTGALFHTKHAVRARLLKDYEIRNEAAHNYKLLPKEAKDISVWLQNLEDLVDQF